MDLRSVETREAWGCWCPERSEGATKGLEGFYTA